MSDKNHELVVPEPDPVDKEDDCDLGWGNGLFTYLVVDPQTLEPVCHFEFPSHSPSAPDVLPVTGRPSPDDDGSLPLGAGGTTPLVTLDLYQDDFISLEMDFGKRDPYQAHQFGTAFASNGPLNDCELSASAADGFRVWSYHPFPGSRLEEDLPEWVHRASDSTREDDQPDWLLRFLAGVTIADECERRDLRGQLECSVDECVTCLLGDDPDRCNPASGSGPDYVSPQYCPQIN